MSHKLIFYTAQSQVVIDAIEKDGYARVKKEYIQKKYGNSTRIFLSAYDWFVKQFQAKNMRPESAEYPFWLFHDLSYVDLYPEQELLKLCIPKNACILFDNSAWEQVLSMNYVGQNPSDQKSFDHKLENMGLDCGYRAFETPFYPHIKREIVDSWDRIFKITENSVIRAAVWEIRKEWVIK